MGPSPMLSALICSALISPLYGPSGPTTDLKFDDVFPRRSYFGKTARGLEWSGDDRYLIYLWNGYDDPGADLWLYDKTTGKSQRMTSMEVMAEYDRDMAKAIARYKAEKYEQERVDKMTDTEYRDWVQKKKKDDAARKEPLASYSGVGEAEWAHHKDELLFTFKGDVFRWKLGDPKPVRLTKTRDNESQVQYTKDDTGFFFRRGDGVYKMSFDSPMVVQLNPELPNNLPLQGYNISPDETKLLIRTGRQLAPDRMVDYISYRNRFATAQKTSRGVADDKFNEEAYLYLCDLTDSPSNDGKAWEIWKWPGGEEWMEAAINPHPWSPDSRKFVFASWKRNKRDLDVVVADTSTKKTEVVFTTKHDGEQNSPGMCDPFYTPDGTKIIGLLETSGFRHAWEIDPIAKAASQITRGDFETYPLEMSKDGTKLWVRSGKEDPARFNVYSVDMKSGSYHQATGQTGSYGNPVLDHKQDMAAGTFVSWSSPTETYLLPLDSRGEEKALTQSHRPGFDATLKIKPQLFTYRNRVGQTIHGYMFLPPGFQKTDKRPLMVYVYGGPLGTGKSVEDGTFNSTATMFNSYLAYVYGFVTVTIDPRGQSGYGAEFGKANWEKPGVAQVEDLSDGVKFLIANYGVDPKKVAVNGWSFGGFQTQMCMYTAPDTFTLGIAGAGPTEWQNYNTWYTGGVIGQSKVGSPDNLDKYSLTKLAKNLRSPLLLLHGMEDTNVLFQDTVKVYQALLQAGKGPLVELTLDPTGSHGLGGDISTHDRHAIYLAFIQRRWGIQPKE